MRLAKSRLYFLTWRKDLNCGGRSGRATETEALGRGEAIALVWNSERSPEQRYGESNKSPIYTACPVETCCCAPHHLYKRYRDVIGVKAVLPLRRQRGERQWRINEEDTEQGCDILSTCVTPDWEIWQPLAANTTQNNYRKSRQNVERTNGLGAIYPASRSSATEETQ